jgi:hypothetical protein
MARKVGSKNQPQRALTLLLKEHFPNYHPVLEMAKLANDKEADSTARFNANREVAQYMEPKRKAVEVTGEDGGPVQVVASAVDEAL